MSKKTRKEVGAIGESAAAAYLVRHGFTIIARNIARKTGEIDVIARDPAGLHFVEVKAIVCADFPLKGHTADRYEPAANLHSYKIRKVARTAEWYMADVGWEGEWQIDGMLVWLRERDSRCLVRYLPQIL